MRKFNVEIQGTTIEITRDVDGKFIIPESMRGLGTSGLKPAAEEWILVQKPIDAKNIAANVLKHGCGGINIDGCRIEIEGHYGPMGKQSPNQPPVNSVGWGNGYLGERPQGRFPANLLLSHTLFCEDECTEDCPVRLLDEQSGYLHGSGNKSDIGLGKDNKYNASSYEISYSGRANRDYGSQGGGASRFFYCAKASKRERNAGLEGTVNGHPTIKPQKLMQYLITLITPPNGVVLDPFMGSGSTGVAAKALGFGFIGIEREPDYFEIAKKRIGA